MHAVFRETTYAPGEDIVSGDAFREFQKVHADREGHRRTVVGRLLDPRMTKPSMLLGTGRVVVNDMVPERTSRH